MIVGSALGSMQSMYINEKSEEITDIMIESVTWVHKVDLHRTNKIRVSDYGMCSSLQFCPFAKIVDLGYLSIASDSLSRHGSSVQVDAASENQRRYP